MGDFSSKRKLWRTSAIAVQCGGKDGGQYSIGTAAEQGRLLEKIDAGGRVSCLYHCGIDGDAIVGIAISVPGQ